ncbi:MAG TPA: MauE/DoxX family redox-associated membrane protein [Phycisphaerales bacterium]|nr:MauE/DoxX family redox-associated membrane protein [Phycisphaerales bacterium]
MSEVFKLQVFRQRLIVAARHSYIVLAFVVCFAAISKSIDPRTPMRILQEELQIPYRSAWQLVAGVAFVEFILGWAMICGIWRRTAVVSTFVVMCVFTVFLAHLIFTGKEEGCGCMGVLESDWFDPRTANMLGVVRNAVLMTIAVCWLKVPGDTNKELQ